MHMELSEIWHASTSGRQAVLGPTGNAPAHRWVRGKVFTPGPRMNYSRHGGRQPGIRRDGVVGRVMAIEGYNLPASEGGGL